MSNPCTEDFERRKTAHKNRVAVKESFADGFERHIAFDVGYDHRAFPKACGGGGHGQHGMNMTWVLIGPKGAVQWLTFLSDLVPGNVTSLGDVPGRSGVMAADLGYHSRTPMYEDQSDYGPCELLNSDTCYYDGSGLNAGPVLEAFVAHGPAAVWVALDDYYKERFA